MEDKKNSFYDFLLANSELQKETKTETKSKSLPLVMGWLVVFFCNVIVLYYGWNNAITSIVKVPSITFTQAILLYSFFKVLIRGFFSPQ